jgi:hypothetical protein
MALIGEQCASHIFAGTGSEKTLQQSQLDDAQQRENFKVWMTRSCDSQRFSSLTS